MFAPIITSTCPLVGGAANVAEIVAAASEELVICCTNITGVVGASIAIGLSTLPSVTGSGASMSFAASIGTAVTSHVCVVGEHTSGAGQTPSGHGAPVLGWGA